MIRIHTDFNLTPLTTFGLPAGCGRFIEFENADDLRQLHCQGELDRVLPIGGGSNLLFTRPFFNGTVIHCTADRPTFTPADPDTVLCHAPAGVTLDRLCAQTCEMGLWGLENLSGIPGEIAGASVQNVGAYGTEFTDVVVEVETFDTLTGTTRTFTREECRYGYRDSAFKHSPLAGHTIVLGATIALSRTPRPRLNYAGLASRVNDIPMEQLTPSLLRREVLALRDSKLPDPAETGSAGSFFKNPVISGAEYDSLRSRLNIDLPGHVLNSGDVKLSAAWLIDHAGCKQLTCGGAALWPSQPLVLVNATGKATGADVTGLENLVIRQVHEKFGIRLSAEVVHIG